MSNANAVPRKRGPVADSADNEVLQTLPNQALEQMVPARCRKPRWLPRHCRSTGNFVARPSIRAKAASQQSGIPHQLIVAQAALESGWGRRDP